MAQNPISIYTFFFYMYIRYWTACNLLNDINRHKTRCQWCPKLYTSARAYSTHLTKVHPTENLQALEETRKHQFSDLSDYDSSLDPEQIPQEISQSNFVSPDLESENEGSDRELLDISSDYDSDGGLNCLTLLARRSVRAPP